MKRYNICIYPFIFWRSLPCLGYFSIQSKMAPSKKTINDNGVIQSDSYLASNCTILQKLLNIVGTVLTVSTISFHFYFLDHMYCVEKQVKQS